MRSLDASLLTAQKDPVNNLVKIQLTQGANDDTYLITGTGFIYSMEHSEQRDSQKATVVLDNSEGTFDAKTYGEDMYKGVISWGLVDATGTDKYSACAPLYVVGQQFHSSPGYLLCILSLIGILDLMAQDKASAEYVLEADDSQTVKTLLTSVIDGTIAPFSHCVGFTATYDSEDSLIDSLVPADAFRISLNETRLEVINRLLVLTKCVKRVETDGAVHIFVPAVDGPTWTVDTKQEVNDYVQPTSPNNNFRYRCSAVAGDQKTAAVTEPTWPTTAGDTVVDDQVTWIAVAPDFEYTLDAGDHAFYKKARRERVVMPNFQKVDSHPDSDDSYTGSAEHKPSSDLTPDSPYTSAEIREHKYMRLTSDEEAGNVAAALLEGDRLDAEKGSASVLIHCGAEAMDYTKLKDSRHVTEDIVIGNIGYLTRHYRPNVWDMRFGFGDPRQGGFLGLDLPGDVEITEAEAMADRGLEGERLTLQWLLNRINGTRQSMIMINNNQQLWLEMLQAQVDALMAGGDAAGLQAVIDKLEVKLLLELKGLAPELRFTESDQADPAGRYRLRLNAGVLVLEHATGGSWASDVDIITINPGNDRIDLAAREANDWDVFLAGTLADGAHLYLYGHTSTPAGALLLLTTNADGSSNLTRLTVSGATATALATWNAIQHTGVVLRDLVLQPGASALTISGGVITVTRSAHEVDTQSGAGTDDLDTINGGISYGHLLVLKATHTDRTIVVKHGTGNIQMLSEADVVLDNTEKAVMFFWDGSNWLGFSAISTGDIVLKTLFDANTILMATSDDTPVALTVTEQTLVGRLTGGNIAAIALGIADNNIVQIDGSPNSAEYAKFTANGLEGKTFAELLADLSGQAGAAFDWNSQNLTGLGTLNTHTLPGGTDTVCLIAASQELDNKTLDASVAKGTWTASGTWTIPAVTLGGDVTVGSQKLIATSGLTIGLAGSAPSPDQGGVHIWAGSAGAGVTANANTLLILEKNANVLMAFLSSAGGVQGFEFGDNVDNNAGRLLYRHATDQFDVDIAGSNRLIYSAGAFAFQESTTLSTDTGTLTFGAATLGGTLTLNGQTLDAGSVSALIATTGGGQGLQIISTQDGDLGAVLSLKHISATPANFDRGGDIHFRTTNDNSEDILAVFVIGRLNDVSDGAEVSQFLIYGLDAGTQNLGLTLSGAGGLSVDADIGTADDPVALFDKYDDALVLRQGIRQRNCDLLVDIGVFSRKNSGSGYMMNIQPMTRLLAGGIYQNRAKIDALEKELTELKALVGRN